MSYEQEGDRKENNGKLIYANSLSFYSKKEQSSGFDNCSLFSYR